MLGSEAPEPPKKRRGRKPASENKTYDTLFTKKEIMDRSLITEKGWGGYKTGGEGKVKFRPTRREEGRKGLRPL